MTIQQLLDSNPTIGMLNRKGKIIYYVTLPVYREAYHPVDLIKSL